MSARDHFQSRARGGISTAVKKLFAFRNLLLQSWMNVAQCRRGKRVTTALSIFRDDLFIILTIYTLHMIYFHVEMVPMKATLLCVLLCLLWSLVEVQSQIEYPYLTFRGNNLPNHSYVDITQVGQERTGSGNDTVQCHTNLMTCCKDNQEVPRGDWFVPAKDTRLGRPGERGYMFQDRNNRVVHLCRKNNGPTGIYRCVIATNDDSVGETLYVGLYGSEGGMYKTTHYLYHTHVLYDL